MNKNRIYAITWIPFLILGISSMPAIARAEAPGASCQAAAKETLEADEVLESATCETAETCADKSCFSDTSIEGCGEEGDSYCCVCSHAKTEAGGGSLAGSEYPNPLGAGVGINDVIGRVVKAFLGIVGAVSLVVFIYGGVAYMTAGGEEAGVTKARDALKYGIIGLAAVILAYTIVSYYLQVFVGK